MALKDANEKMKFDKRLIELQIRRGLISKDELEKHLSNLEDLADRSELLWEDYYPEAEENDFSQLQ